MGITSEAVKVVDGPPPTIWSTIRESAAKSREAAEKRAEKPHPWVTLKLAILVALAMIGYATYVVIGRVCIPFIEDSGTRAKGVGLMVGYLIILLVMLWSYMVVVITPPGKATDVSSLPTIFTAPHTLYPTVASSKPTF